MIIYVAIITFFSLACGAQGDTCHPGFIPFGSSCYSFIDHPMTWTEAESTCLALGGFLAEVSSAEENSFLRKIVHTAGKNDVWLGGTDLIQEGHWFWVKSGHPMDKFTSWSSGEPDHHSPEDENCLEMSAHDGDWNDDQCYHKKEFICERLPETTVVG